MIKNEPNDSFLNYALALEYAKEGDVKKAIDLIEVLLSKDEAYLGAYYQLGKYYEECQESERAIATYRKGIAISEKQKNIKATSELNAALWMLED
jgi:Tfp pilus assembly protein PilF